mmetsp:Transcript_34021/g.70238  ORF Transcript_34021/g.70238 Transcript_34021/m.70238 type:complete len:109 (+) Transcript_34021:23-349(+)|eukprot:CAMPEP_0181324484 /NCGR_PEP_ID=MMETSP1101-20121128/20386_1 /TAXON_ID=46948 /ORGANISM="Rhodomonas abbreviata, Strain Caron Lab Isolate" /LENGTH=108 /DNA_ID=CAMNT_0023432667 /DNA_START=22 /DNA_END=348 /DNA_ORIENTATION=-
MAKKVEQKTKEQKAKAAMAGGNRKGKKKWAKGKARDKAFNAVLFEQKAFEKLSAELPKLRLITTSVVMERFKTTGSLARAVLRKLADEGAIKEVARHSKQVIYTRLSH